MSTECLTLTGADRNCVLGSGGPKPLIVFFSSAKILTQVEVNKQQRLFTGKGSCKGLSVIYICVQGILFSRVLFCLHLVWVLAWWVMSGRVNTWEAHLIPFVFLRVTGLSIWLTLVWISSALRMTTFLNLLLPNSPSVSRGPEGMVPPRADWQRPANSLNISSSNFSIYTIVIKLSFYEERKEIIHVRDNLCNILTMIAGIIVSM